MSSHNILESLDHMTDNKPCQLYTIRWMFMSLLLSMEENIEREVGQTEEDKHKYGGDF